MPIKGSCLCGAVKYEVTAPFQFLDNCHCSMCRKPNGAAFATWGVLQPGTFRWTYGEDLLGSYKTSPGQTRCFCKRCGSTLASAHSRVVGEVVVGTVDGDPGARPCEHIFVGSKAPWCEITDMLPQHLEWPSGLPGEAWSAASTDIGFINFPERRSLNVRGNISCENRCSG